MLETDFNSDKRVNILKQRTRRCVCRYCGSRLKLKRIVFSDYEDTRVEIFCSNCDRIEFGVEQEIYNSAKYFVENTRFNCFPELDDNERTKEMTIAKVCEIMDWEARNLGIVNEKGFTVELNINENILGKCITLSDDDLTDVELEDKFALED